MRDISVKTRVQQDKTSFTRLVSRVRDSPKSKTVRRVRGRVSMRRKQDRTRQDKTRQDETRHDKTRQDNRREVK